MKDYSEKRDFHRMQVNSEIEISDSQGNRFKGICRDLSATGMQLYVEQAVNVGEELQEVSVRFRTRLAKTSKPCSDPACITGFKFHRAGPPRWVIKVATESKWGASKR